MSSPLPWQPLEEKRMQVCVGKGSKHYNKNQTLNDNFFGITFLENFLLVKCLQWLDETCGYND